MINEFKFNEHEKGEKAFNFYLASKGGCESLSHILCHYWDLPMGSIALSHIDDLGPPNAIKCDGRLADNFFKCTYGDLTFRILSESAVKLNSDHFLRAQEYFDVLRRKEETRPQVILLIFNELDNVLETALKARRLAKHHHAEVLFIQPIYAMGELISFKTLDRFSTGGWRPKDINQSKLGLPEGNLYAISILQKYGLGSKALKNANELKKANSYSIRVWDTQFNEIFIDLPYRLEGERKFTGEQEKAHFEDELRRIFNGLPFINMEDIIASDKFICISISANHREKLRAHNVFSKPSKLRKIVRENGSKFSHCLAGFTWQDGNGRFAPVFYLSKLIDEFDKMSQKTGQLKAV